MKYLLSIIIPALIFLITPGVSISQDSECTADDAYCLELNTQAITDLEDGRVSIPLYIKSPQAIEKLEIEVPEIYTDFFSPIQFQISKNFLAESELVTSDFSILSGNSTVTIEFVSLERSNLLVSPTELMYIGNIEGSPSDPENRSFSVEIKEVKLRGISGDQTDIFKITRDSLYTPGDLTDLSDTEVLELLADTERFFTGDGSHPTANRTNEGDNAINYADVLYLLGHWKYNRYDDNNSHFQTAGNRDINLIGDFVSANQDVETWLSQSREDFESDSVVTYNHSPSPDGAVTYADVLYLYGHWYFHHETLDDGSKRSDIYKNNDKDTPFSL